MRPVPRSFPEGTPCWADAALPDVEAGKRFYGDLFGWTFDEGAGAERGYYTAAYSADRGVAALAPGRAAWTVHVAVQDTYAAAERTLAAGGRILAAPVSDGTVATVARAAGPEGAPFGLWQPGSHQGFERTGAPGTLCHVELRTPVPAASDPFYEGVFGYLTDERAPGVRDWHPRTPPEPGAPGLARLYAPGEAPRFLLHFGAAGVAAGCWDATRLGARVLVAPHDTPYGRSAVLVDDQGAEFALWEPFGG
ncbi:VOC family protein [Streptomyces longispororuber]|uniref:VOC family protein n=1 Tax=Streptomyces longispororuber TaxID=68230 RepID=UPI00272DF0D5|nr:VOC family protein [Streptomyces longispororuber]